MPVPVVTAASTSPSPAKVPPVIDTVAPARSTTPGSDTTTALDSTTAAAPSVKFTLGVTLLRVSGPLQLKRFSGLRPSAEAPETDNSEVPAAVPFVTHKP